MNADQRCPMTGEPNHCRLADGCLFKGRCWCEEIEVPGHVLRHLAAQSLEPVCLSRPALLALAEAARRHDEPGSVVALALDTLGRAANPHPGH